MKKEFVTIDLGSTQASYCLFSSERGIQRQFLSKETSKNIENLPGVLSSVRKEAHLIKDFPFLNSDSIYRISNYFYQNNFFDMPVQYSNTLGQDRLANAYWIWKNEKLKNDKKIFVIDAGTFLTIDKISTKGFEGGYIFPGINNLLKSYQSGENLPQLKMEDWKAQLNEAPHNTKSAILDSIELLLTKAFHHLIDGKYQVYLTGGESQTLAKLFIKNKIEFHLSPYLIHLGLAQTFHAIQENIS